MAEYKLTNRAIADLNAIWGYTFDEWSEAQADRYYNILLDSCQAIADNPALGKNYTGVRTDLFGLKVNRHIIFYRKPDNTPIEITRFLHERMDLKSRISE